MRQSAIDIDVYTTRREIEATTAILLLLLLLLLLFVWAGVGRWGESLRRRTNRSAREELLSTAVDLGLSREGKSRVGKGRVLGGLVVYLIHAWRPLIG